MKPDRKPKTLDVNEIALQVVEKATSQEFKPEALSTAQISQVMAHLGRKGGLKGGRARAEKLTPKKRSMIAKKAAKMRWGKSK